MPTVRIRGGFLRFGRRRGLHPDQELPGEEEDQTPDWGLPEGELPEVEPPDPPAGIWPPLTPEHPWRPIPERPEFPDRPSQGPVPTPPTPPAGGIGGTPPDRPEPGEPGTPGHLPVFPPGAIWPPLPPGVHGKYWGLMLIGGFPGGPRYRYVVVDADARPEPPAGGIGGRPPGRPEPQR